MPVVSINLTPKSLAELDELKERMGFAGRSDAIRAALRHFHEDTSSTQDFEGTIEGILLLLHDHTPRDRLDRLIHDHQALLRTQLHQHLDCGKCMDLFIVKGTQGEVKLLLNSCRRMESIDNIRFVPTGYIADGKCLGHGGHEIDAVVK